MPKLNYIKSLIILFIGVLIPSCADTLVLPGNGDSSYPGVMIDGDELSLDVSLDIPEIVSASTRAMDDTPDYANLHLYLIEFDDNGAPVTNSLTHVYKAEDETVEGSIVKFRVKLNASDRAKILHLIAVPEDEEIIVGYGPEANIIPHLAVSYGVEAYWRRIEFPNGYCTEALDGTWAPDADLIQKLTRVPLIRNFAKISFSCTDPNFQLKGFAVMNTPQAGTIAPWNSRTLSFPVFLDSSDKMVQYGDLNRSYTGILPAGTGFDNQVSGFAPSLTPDDKYLYERPFSRDRTTFVVFYGRRKGSDQDFYYKLDIGQNDASGVFRQYNILRNFDFHFTLTKVDKDGATNAEEAIEGFVSNNFSFALNTQNIHNISDGHQIVYVNKTLFILTDSENEETIIFKYKYLDLTDRKYYNDDANVTFVGLEAGPVIKSFKKDTTDDAEGWRTVEITCYKAEKETRSQEFSIVNHNGLGRTIELSLHTKWEYKDLREYNGRLVTWNDDTPGLEIGGEGDQDPLTIFFDLPNDLPEAVFPLTFLLEADRQNLDNDLLGNMSVVEGPSFFPVFENQVHIKYEKIVTLTQYNSMLDLNADPETSSDQGTIIKDENGNILTHRVHCRMRTTRSLAQMNVPIGSSIDVKVWIQDTEGNFIADGENNVVNFTRTRTK